MNDNIEEEIKLRLRLFCNTFDLEKNEETIKYLPHLVEDVLNQASWKICLNTPPTARQIIEHIQHIDNTVKKNLKG